MSVAPGGGLGPALVAAFLLLATCTQMLLALYGLLSRYVQVKAVPPVPALRLVVVTNLIAEACMVCFHLAPKLALAWARRRRARLAAQRAGLPLADASPDPGSKPSARQPTNVGGLSSEEGGDARARAVLTTAKTTVRPPAVLLRGFSQRMDRWERERPVLRRRLALAAITVSFCGCCSLQILAPGFVDVSIVMLTTQWTTLGIALAQALLLRHRLPRIFWPCAAVMLGGAAMVIAPAVSQSTSGSLSTMRGWWGFIMAIGALISTVVYYVLLQATRHFGFTPLQLQHCMNVFSILFFLPLTLPIDGTDWSVQFRGWSATQWVALAMLSTACYLGSGMCMQVCVWKLGAPTASIFFGLRLVFSVVLSTPILGSTIIQTGVQIAGVVVTALGVTTYAFSQWLASRRQQQQQQKQQAKSEAVQAPPVEQVSPPVDA